MNSNADLETWRLLWHAERESPAVAGLRERVTRATRRRKLLLIAPSAVTVGIGGWVAAQALRSGRFEDLVLALQTWLFISALWAVGLWSDRGTWRPLGNTTSAFLDLSIRRCRSALTAARIAVPVYVVQLSAIVAWTIHFSRSDVATLVRSWPFLLIGWMGLPATSVFCLVWARRKKRELHELTALRKQLLDD